MKCIGVEGMNTRPNRFQWVEPCSGYDGECFTVWGFMGDCEHLVLSGDMIHLLNKKITRLIRSFHR